MIGRRAGWGSVVLAGACVMALACSGGGDKPAATGGATTGAAGGGKPIKIAMIAKSSDNPVFLAARTGAETAVGPVLRAR